MQDKHREALLEGIKDFLRVELLAVVPVLVVALQTPEVTVKIVLLQTLVAVLKGVDKFLHKAEKKALPF